MPTPAEIRADHDAAFREFRADVDRLPPEQFAARDSDGWTVQEMLGHVAFWEEAGVPVIAYMNRGKQIPDPWEFGSGYIPKDEWPHFSVHNAREGAWAREQPLAAVLARWDRAHAALQETLATVTPEETVTHASYFEELIGHLREHHEELRAAISPSA